MEEEGKKQHSGETSRGRSAIRQPICSSVQLSIRGVLYLSIHPSPNGQSAFSPTLTHSQPVHPHPPLLLPSSPAVYPPAHPSFHVLMCPTFRFLAHPSPVPPHLLAQPPRWCQLGGRGSSDACDVSPPLAAQHAPRGLREAQRQRQGDRGRKVSGWEDGEQPGGSGKSLQETMC